VRVAPRGSTPILGPMPAKEIVEYPLEIYQPFSSVETALLRAYVTDARRLGDMSLFKQTPKKATFSWSRETGASTEMEEPSDESVRAALTIFRQLYSPSEPHSFRRIINLLKRSVHEHDGPRRQEALEFLDYYPAEHSRRMEPGVGLSFDRPTESENIDVETIIDAYLHGYYFHGSNQKSDLARQLDEVDPFPRFTLYTTVHYLAGLYWMAANTIDCILKVPSLLDSDARDSGADAA